MRISIKTRRTRVLQNRSHFPYYTSQRFLFPLAWYISFIASPRRILWLADERCVCRGAIGIGPNDGGGSQSLHYRRIVMLSFKFYKTCSPYTRSKGRSILLQSISLDQNIAVDSSLMSLTWPTLLCPIICMIYSPLMKKSGSSFWICPEFFLITGTYCLKGNFQTRRIFGF